MSMKIVGEWESIEEGGELEKLEECRKVFFFFYIFIFEEFEILFIIMLISFWVDYF